MSESTALIPQMLIPVLPSLDAIRPFIETIDGNNIYSNDGPLNRRLCSELAQYVAQRLIKTVPLSATTVTNGTVAIELALRARAGRSSPYVMLPAYTFIATAHAVKNVGFKPLFIDVDPVSLTVTPSIAHTAMRSHGKPAALVVVSPFGGAVDVECWEQFEAETGVPVIFDLAAGITAIRHVSKQPICISLHATKMIGSGEGGAVLSADADLVSRIKQMASFGFKANSRISEVPGGNYRISEYAAAVGLASLQSVGNRMSLLFDKARLYKRCLSGSEVQYQPGFGEDWVAMTMNVILKAERIQPTLEAFDAHGIPWRRWWSHGCHTHPAFADAAHSQLTYTDMVAHRTIGIPFHVKLTEEQIEFVGQIIKG